MANWREDKVTKSIRKFLSSTQKQKNFEFVDIA